MLKAIDFFCGGGGMSFGMQSAGIKVLAGIDSDINCKETYEANIKAKFIEADVFNLKESELQNQLNLDKNDNQLILIGCSPCQYWSIINTDKKKSEKSKNLLIEFVRFVKYFLPGYVVVENVPGILRKKDQSGLSDFVFWLEENKYKVHYDIHNVNDYGVPQSRRRFTLIANRVSEKEIIPQKELGKKLVLKDVLGVNNGFFKIPAGYKDESDFLHTTPKLSFVNLERLKYIKKNGGNRLGFSHIENLQLKCFINKDNSFVDTYGRMCWTKPSPTITTKFYSISNGRFIHPDEDRAISLREGAVLQTFPKTYKFIGNSIAGIARLIGNAVPPEFARRIGNAILKESSS